MPAMCPTNKAAGLSILKGLISALGHLGEEKAIKNSEIVE